MHATKTATQTIDEIAPAEKTTILVVDDSKVARNAIEGILEEDFRVVLAKDGSEAWDLISRDRQVQVVISDLMMPKTNGFQLLRRIRQSIHPRINQLPMIIITGHEDDETMRRRAMSLGASDFITKPFDAIQIKVRARSYAKHGDTARKLAENSTIDTLTGLGNKRYFQKHGTGLLAFAARQGADVAVLRLDVDKFDVLAKKLGNQVADKILLNISKIIKASVRQEDGVARVDRAKFAVVMPGSDEEGARILAKRIHGLINKTVYRFGKNRFRMTASAVLVWHDNRVPHKLEDIVKLAEKRLAKAMDEGGASLVFDHEISPPSEAQDVPEQSPEDPLSLDDVLVLLKAGQVERVDEQLRTLAARIYPLLEHMDQQLGLGMDSCLKKLQTQLQGVNVDFI